MREEANDRSSKQAVANDSAAKGAKVYQFDPQAAPQDKAASALNQAKETIAPVQGASVQRTHIATGECFGLLMVFAELSCLQCLTELATDINSRPGPAPTVSLSDATAQDSSLPSSGVPEGKLSNGKVSVWTAPFQHRLIDWVPRLTARRYSRRCTNRLEWTEEDP